MADNDFIVENGEFTVFVVSKRYFQLRGKEYLRQYLGTKHWINSNNEIKKRIKLTSDYLYQKTPDASELIDSLLTASQSKQSSTNDLIISLTKLFAVTEHKSDDVLDPIIIEEGDIQPENLIHFLSILSNSFYSSTVIFILNDKDFDRAKILLSACPNNMNVCMIYDDHTKKTYKVINTGAKNINEFMDSYVRQCFSTCSRTERGILTTQEWTSNPIINTFSPTVFNIRSTFIKEHKLYAADNINWLVTNLAEFEAKGTDNKLLKLNLECIANLFRVYCNDRGGSELKRALDIAKELNSDLLLAHVYRYCHFWKNSRKEKQDFLLEAEKTFIKYDIEDHAVYCNNNSIIHQFSLDKINLNNFIDLEKRARTNTPGLALMSHIINNVGVAYLFERDFIGAIMSFDRGLKYSGNTDIQELALRSNRISAVILSGEKFDDKEAYRIMERIFSPSLGLKRMPFLTAQFALNVLACAQISDPQLVRDLLTQYQLRDLIQTAFHKNIMGTGSMIKQLGILAMKSSLIDRFVNSIDFPKEQTSVSGIRLDFICTYGINPFFFNTWL